ncbi:MAG: haloacid dehalogenase-like hydrolase [Acidobacteria bacterium]|nr:haloacid dehalogenase-like hydrolase [Acidobacteriota bacterium]
MHLVVFDVDGTLVESDEFDGILYARAVREVLDIDVDDDWSGYRHVTDSGILEEILDRHGIEGDHSATHALVRKTFAALVRDDLARRNGRLPEIPGAAAFVNRLVAHPEVSVGVATGGWRETAAMKLRAIGLDPGTLHFASGSDAIRRTEIMRMAERRALAGGSGDRKTYFGNQPWDREASLSLGWNFVGIGSSVRHHIRFCDYLDYESIEVVLGLRSPVG